MKIVFNEHFQIYGITISLVPRPSHILTYSGELRTGTMHAHAIIGRRGRHWWYSRPKGPLTNFKAEYVDCM